MSSISSVCSLNTFTTITRTAHTLDWGREHRTLEAALYLQAAFFLVSDWAVCTIDTTALPEARTELVNCRAKTILYFRTEPFKKRYHSAIAHRHRIGASICGSQCERSHRKLRRFRVQI